MPEHPVADRCWFCAPDERLPELAAAGPLPQMAGRRRFHPQSPPSACPFVDDDGERLFNPQVRRNQ